MPTKTSTTSLALVFAGAAAGVALTVNCGGSGDSQADAGDSDLALRVEALEQDLDDMRWRIDDLEAAFGEGLSVEVVEGTTEELMTSAALCTGGRHLVGGGCGCDSGNVQFSYPERGLQWNCACTGGTQTAFALCADIGEP